MVIESAKKPEPQLRMKADESHLIARTRRVVITKAHPMTMLMTVAFAFRRRDASASQWQDATSATLA
jgi:hypothetical protein